MVWLLGDEAGSSSAGCHDPAGRPKSTETYVYTKTCTRMFLAALFMIVKEQKQPTGQPTNEWTNKTQHSLPVGYRLGRRKECSTDTGHSRDGP